MTNSLLSLDEPNKKTVEHWEKWYAINNPWKYVGKFDDRIRNQIIINLIRWSKLDKGIDMACGEGSLTKSLSPYIRSIKAFDISARAIESAKNNYAADNIEYFQLDMHDFSREIGHFDFILCAEVIYYLDSQEIERVLNEIGESLTKEGYFILTTRISYWFGFDDLLGMLNKRFKVITIVPVWRPYTLFFKFVKLIFSIFSPALDNVYRSFLMSMDPKKSGMCAYLCINK